MAKPEKPTAMTRNVMATPFVWENPTTSNRVASIPNPESYMWDCTETEKTELMYQVEKH